MHSTEKSLPNGMHKNIVSLKFGAEGENLSAFSFLKLLLICRMKAKIRE